MFHYYLRLKIRDEPLEDDDDRLPKVSFSLKMFLFKTISLTPKKSGTTATATSTKTTTKPTSS